MSKSVTRHVILLTGALVFAMPAHSSGLLCPQGENMSQDVREEKSGRLQDALNAMSEPAGETPVLISASDGLKKQHAVETPAQTKPDSEEKNESKLNSMFNILVPSTIRDK